MNKKLEEAKNILKYHGNAIASYDKDNRTFKAIETVLKELERLQEENRHLNIIILKDYISKFVIRNKLEQDKANYIDAIHADNKVESVQKYITYLEKELLEEK